MQIQIKANGDEGSAGQAWVELSEKTLPPICMSFGLRLEGQGRAIVGIHNVPKGEGVKHFISSVVHLEGNGSF